MGEGPEADPVASGAGPGPAVGMRSRAVAGVGSPDEEVVCMCEGPLEAGGCGMGAGPAAVLR